MRHRSAVVIAVAMLAASTVVAITGSTAAFASGGGLAPGNRYLRSGHAAAVKNPGSGLSTNYDWARLVLTDGGWPTSSNNVTVITRWMASEEPPSGWWNRNNPLNNGLGSGGGSGLGSYVDLPTAAYYVALNLESPNYGYPAIASDLASSADPTTTAHAIWSSSWASSHYSYGSGWYAGTAPTVAAPAANWGSGGSPAVIDGSFVSHNSYVYRVAGGAPIYVSNWAVFGGPQPTTTLTDAQFAALRQFPADGTTIVGTGTGQVYKIAGGAPVYLNSCDPGCGSPIAVDQAAIDHAGEGVPWDHLRKYPADGTTVVAVETGQVYKIAGGAPVYLNSCNPGCGSPVALNQYEIDNGGLGHLLKYPADGTTLRAVETARIYKVAGGAALYLSSCDPGCGSPVAMNQWSIDNGGLGHLSAFPSDGTTLQGLPSGQLSHSSSACLATGNGTSAAVLVNDSTISALKSCEAGSTGTGSSGGTGPTSSDLSAPGRPVSLTAVARRLHVVLRWQRSQVGGSPSQYLVQWSSCRFTSGCRRHRQLSTGMKTSVSGLHARHRYYFRVKAYNKAGHSRFTAPVSAVPRP